MHYVAKSFFKTEKINEAKPEPKVYQDGLGFVWISWKRFTQMHRQSFTVSFTGFLSLLNRTGEGIVCTSEAYGYAARQRLVIKCHFNCFNVSNLVHKVTHLLSSCQRASFWPQIKWGKKNPKIIKCWDSLAQWYITWRLHERKKNQKNLSSIFTYLQPV